MRTDIGAGPFGSPYRWRPLEWKVSGDANVTEYCNERATSTQQTGFVFVAESRNWLPDPIGGIFWFGVDDAATQFSIRYIVVLLRSLNALQVGNGDMLTYSANFSFLGI